VSYYTLAVLGSPPAGVPGRVEVGTFTADEIYETPRLAYRTSPFQIQYYTFHRWAAGSSENAVSAAVRDYLASATDAGSAPPVRIDGHLRRIEEVDADGQRSGIVVLELSASCGDAPCLTHAYEDSERAEEDTPEAVVAAMSRALGRILDRFVADLNDAVATKP
jgi:hypothetical protein